MSSKIRYFFALFYSSWNGKRTKAWLIQLYSSQEYHGREIEPEEPLEAADEDDDDEEVDDEEDVEMQQVLTEDDDDDAVDVENWNVQKSTSSTLFKCYRGQKKT